MKGTLSRLYEANSCPSFQTALNVILLIVVYLQYLSIFDKKNCSFPSSELISLKSTPTIPSQLKQPSIYRRLLDNSHPVYQGVAATIILGSAKSMRNRYSMMINQMITTIPPDWIVQIFFDASIFSAVESVRKNAGLQKQVHYGRVILTELPVSMYGVKRKDILKSIWLWENMLAETVLLFFSANTALCANSPFNLTYFSQFDYIGAPWTKGAGGSHEITLRKKSTVLQALHSVAHELNGMDGREDTTLVKILMNQSGAVVAHHKDTLKFAMTNHIAEGTPFASVGTLQSFNDETRQQFLDYCPEMKMVFPSLHNPSCFGHSTAADFCFKSLCLNGGVDCSSKNFSIQFDSAKGYKVIQVTISSFDKR